MAVAGWKKHFKEKFQIVVVGDWHPVCNDKCITFINCPRVKWPGKGNYWAHIDHVNKFRTVRKEFPDSNGFIYTCDDIYAVNNFKMKDVLQPKVRLLQIGGSFHHSNAWVVDNYKTRKILEKNHLPTMNWVCHLPVYYEWDKLFAIYDKYHCDTHSYVVEQLYFNTYFADSDYVVLEECDLPNKYQMKMWDNEWTVSDLKLAMKDKIWVVNSVKGWKPEIEEVLASHYGI